MIRVYQVLISFDHGLLKVFYPNGYCRYHPTCSDYGYQAIERFGIIKGTFLACRRVLRCHPWAPGGIDEVPKS
ncbi:MAG TPA: membrane protein insertion efficiency factor YidD [Candidatus Paceibacterota bacterium]|nr:membrane protein insertion efficiency factor YidD [Candidatus Paceibacterota bacterium]